MSLTLAALLALQLQHNGPNCWGAALLAAGLSDVPRHVSAEEMEFWAGSPFCQEMPHAEAGDIVLVRTRFRANKPWEELHGFGILYGGNALSKTNTSRFSETGYQHYKISSYPEALAEYPVAAHCQNSQPSSDCLRSLWVYRCEDATKISKGASHEWFEVEALLRAAEKRLFARIIADSRSFSDEEQQKWEADVDFIALLLSAHTPRPAAQDSRDRRETARWESLRQRFDSLQWQLREVRDPD